MADEIRLDLGAGDHRIDGFTPIDRRFGSEVYPLDFADESVDEIRASHVLEHFSHREVSTVVNHWVAKLKPGGKLRIAVPNFAWIAENYAAGKPIDVQGYSMGGHKDGNDRHGAIFDEESLREVMVNAGVERIGKWASESKDCASLPVSLNLQGFKPAMKITTLPNIKGVLSAPRYGPVTHFRVAYDALRSLKIDYAVGQGAYWHQVMSELMEKCIAAGAEYVLTCDYDSVFNAQDVLELARLMRAYPEADAVCAVQMKRSTDFALFSMLGPDGKPTNKAYAANFSTNLSKIVTGHFGLTLFRASALSTMPRPWLMPEANHEGRWADGAENLRGKRDADINFWLKWADAGKSLYMANRVPIGHMVEVALWPGKNFAPVYQTTADYFEHGISAEVKR